MTRSPPDAVTLDAMVLGTDTEDDREAWGDLLATPEAAAAWRDAVERRSRIDTFARAAAAHPWLAEATLTLRREMRRLRHRPWPGARVTLGSPLLATLAGEATESVALSWGETRTLEVPVGTEVRVLLPDDTHLRRITPAGEEAYEHAGWLMERGDGLVVLVATWRDGAPVATLVLTEMAAGGELG
ncbi:MAG: hypothetical protein U0324_37070 [Polyangiales bacterium]